MRHSTVGSAGIGVELVDLWTKLYIFILTTKLLDA